MRIHIYYGGRGLIEDPTIAAMNRMTEVLEELRVEVKRYNLFEEKQNINVLPKTLKEADGIILATTVEWLGIGGYMQQFLDACWFYANKEKVKELYMFPMVLATTYGEQEAKLDLIKAWNMLGGKSMDGLCAYVENHIEFETNKEYIAYIESAAENIYRMINKKGKVFPNSQHALAQNAVATQSVELTPQESEQLSMFISDDSYRKKQKEDIEELASMFKGMLGQTEEQSGDIIQVLKDHFNPELGVTVSYTIFLQDLQKTLVVDVRGKELNCYYGEKTDATVVAKTNYTIMSKIIMGQLSFQKAFMTGDIAAKGDFKTLRTFDTIFQFVK